MTTPAENPAATKWYYRLPWTRVMVGAYFVMCGLAGIVAVIYYQPYIKTALYGYLLLAVYATILMVCAALGIFGIFRSLTATKHALWTIAVCTFFHGVGVLLSGRPVNGILMMAVPLLIVPLSWVWIEWLVQIKHVQTGPWPDLRRLFQQ